MVSLIYIFYHLWTLFNKMILVGFLSYYFVVMGSISLLSNTFLSSILSLFDYYFFTQIFVFQNKKKIGKHVSQPENRKQFFILRNRKHNAFKKHLLLFLITIIKK